MITKYLKQYAEQNVILKSENNSDTNILTFLGFFFSIVVRKIKANFYVGLLLKTSSFFFSGEHLGV